MLKPNYLRNSPLQIICRVFILFCIAINTIDPSFAATAAHNVRIQEIQLSSSLTPISLFGDGIKRHS